MTEKIIYYNDLTQDVVKNTGQSFKLPADYQWIRTDPIFCKRAKIMQRLAQSFIQIYAKVYLHQQFVNRQVLTDFQDAGYFLYVNHTQPLGDPFLPMLAGGAERYHAVCSPANLGLPIIGPLLPYGGALPIPDKLHELRRFVAAIEWCIHQKHFITLYPEAHVWPYATMIRPFTEVSFSYPVRLHAPVFVMTNTYQKRPHHRKPKMVSYIDGPFYPDGHLSSRGQKEKLCQQVTQIMVERSQLNEVEYIHYQKRGKL